jgi:ABC-2 type transport system permease protein
MRKILTIARWEFIEKVRTKSFIISLLLTPLIIIAFSLLPALLIDEESERTQVIGMLDPSGIFYREMSKRLESITISGNQPAYILINLFQTDKEIPDLKKSSDSLVVRGTLEGVLYISEVQDSYALEYRTTNTGNIQNIKTFERIFNEVRISNQLISSGVSREIMKDIFNNTELKTIRLDEHGKESESGFLEIYFSSLVFIMLLIFIILSSGGMLIRSLVEEKSNRLIEILVSSCKPEELLTGKILGLSMLALAQIIIWALLSMILTGIQIIPASAFNNILPMFVYFLLGFLFYTALFVGIGSIVNTEQEAQQITGYLTLVLLLPIIFAVSTIQNPDSFMVKVLTYIPFTTPTIMILKFNIKPVPAEEIILTTALLLFSIFLIVSFTSRIFRIGILSYGKMPTLRQVLQWVRED